MVIPMGQAARHCGKGDVCGASIVYATAGIMITTNTKRLFARLFIG
jgi:hypothetical protein